MKVNKFLILCTLFLWGGRIMAEDIQPFAIEVILFSKNPHKTQAMKDFQLGEILNVSLLDEQEKQLLETLVRPFLDGLMEGQVLEDFLTPEARIYIDDEYAGAFSDYRVGPLGYRGEFIVLPVRLMNYSSSALGFLYLFKGDEAWQIEDLEVSLEELRTEKKGGEPFSPSSLINPF